ncbi:hypothetical protein HBH70_010550 [Parastagonospora nodorum]|nr:hypothetical protein HBH47_041320 [Parastagonospora nodorum]KAH5151769.1 hypothetical protein HBH70_010550 [Parastagonospora nodorum]KAH6233115.1 hypothetical protein HBI43_025590 [Parastagonospora nodorum]
MEAATGKIPRALTVPGSFTVSKDRSSHTMQNCVLQLQATTKLTRLRPPGGFSHMAACCIGYYQHTPASVWLLEQDTTIACLLCWSSCI